MNEPIQSPPPPDNIETEEAEKRAADSGNVESVVTHSDAPAIETEPSLDPPPNGARRERGLTVWDLFPHADKDPQVDEAYRRFRAGLEAKAKQAEERRKVDPTFNDAPESFITGDEAEIIEPPQLRHAPPATREEAVLLLGRVAGRCEAGIENLATALWPGFHLAERQKSMAVAACLTNALANIVRTMNQIGGTKHSMLVEKIDRTQQATEKDERGGQAGNHNAVTSGLHTKEARQRRRAVHALLSEVAWALEVTRPFASQPHEGGGVPLPKTNKES